MVEVKQENIGLAVRVANGLYGRVAVFNGESAWPVGVFCGGHLHAFRREEVIPVVAEGGEVFPSANDQERWGLFSPTVKVMEGPEMWIRAAFDQIPPRYKEDGWFIARLAKKRPEESGRDPNFFRPGREDNVPPCFNLTEDRR